MVAHGRKTVFMALMDLHHIRRAERHSAHLRSAQGHARAMAGLF